MRLARHIQNDPGSQGFTLIEAVISLLLLSFLSIALVSLSASSSTASVRNEQRAFALERAVEAIERYRALPNPPVPWSQTTEVTPPGHSGRTYVVNAVVAPVVLSGTNSERITVRVLTPRREVVSLTTYVARLDSPADPFTNAHIVSWTQHR